MEPVPFRIQSDPIGGRIEINGHDITNNIEGVELYVGHDRASILRVYAVPGTGVIEGAALVEQVADTSEVISAFLEAIDPDELDRDALANADASTNLTATMLTILKHYATGRACQT